MIASAQSLQLKGAGRMVELEDEVSRDLGYAGAIATPTGSYAIGLVLRAQFPSGARVGCPSYICRSVYDVIVMARCEPCLLEILDFCGRATPAPCVGEDGSRRE